MIKDIEKLIKRITDEIDKNIDIAVVGMSGGADSTLVAILCKLALGENNVYGVHMPYDALDEKTFNCVSVEIAKALGIRSLYVPIGNIANEIISTVGKGMEQALGGSDQISIVNAGNARSRSRMTILYGISHELSAFYLCKARVVGTGNLSEDSLGYDTKGGDALADVFPIGDLFKSEVYQLLDYFRDKGIITEQMINRTPSAGLWDGQTDEGELGFTYNEMEVSVRKYLASEWEPILNPLPIDKFVHERHESNKHKHLAPPTIQLRDFCD